MAKKELPKLPILTQQEVEDVIKNIENFKYKDKLNYEGICCGTDGVEMGFSAALDVFRELYGIKVEWPGEEEYE